MDRSASADPAPRLPELLRTLREAQRTCVVRVSDGVRRGEVIFDQGELVEVWFGQLRGAAAMAALVEAEALQHELLEAADSDSLRYEELFSEDEELLDEDSGAELRASAVSGTIAVGVHLELVAEPALDALPTAVTADVLDVDLASLESEGTDHPPADVADTGAASLDSAGDEAVPSADDSAGAAGDLASQGAVQAGDELASAEARGTARERRAEEAARTSDDSASTEARGSAGARRDEEAAQTADARPSRPVPRTSGPIPREPTVGPVGLLSSLLPPEDPPRRRLPRWLALAASGALLAAIGFGWLRPKLERAGAAKFRSATSPAVSPERAVELLEAPTVTAPRGGWVPTVLLRVRVGADGSVEHAEVQAPRPALAALERQAVEAAARMRFRPAVRDGRPVQVWTTVPLRFVPAPLERSLVIKGSDTIGAALGPAWAEAFEKSESGLRVRVEALGSNTGFAGLLDGSADVAASSRPVRIDELAFAEKLGVELREVVAGYDGIAVIVHPDNPVRELQLATLARVFAQRVTRWSELSGADAPIHVFGRPSYSGTHAFFKERVFATLGQDTGFGASVTDLEASKEIAARIAKDVHAIGYVSLGHMRPEVRALALSGAGGAPGVTPSATSIRDGSYPIARPLFLYLRTDSGRDARAFVDFALSPSGQALLQGHGFVPLEAGAQPALGAERPSPEAPKPELVRVYFGNASASIPQDARAGLRAAAAALRTGRRALVIGNADGTGDPAVNRRIAERRAQAVAATLKQYGSGAAPIEIEVADSQHPLASNATAEGRSANRRVDLIVLGGLTRI